MAGSSNSIKQESVKQLLARLGDRPSISSLDDQLFNNLSDASMIEVCGDAGCGKTELFYRWLVKCILPKHFKGRDVGGFDAAVIYIDNDCKLSIRRLSKLILKKLEHIFKKEPELSEGNVLDECLKKCLSNLSILTCESSDEFLVTLLSLEDHILSNSKISLVVIDSISAFYWLDKMNCMDNFKLVEEHHKKVMFCLKKLLHELKINVIVSRQSLMNPKKGSEMNKDNIFNDGFEFMGKCYQQMLNYRIRLHVMTTLTKDKTVVRLKVWQANSPIKLKTFTIDENSNEIS